MLINDYKDGTDPSINKSVAKVLATALPGVFILEMGLTKITHSIDVVETMTHAGLNPFITWIGLLQVVLAFLFMYGKTLRPAMLGISLYYTGSIVTDLSRGGNGLTPFTFLLICWFAAIVRNGALIPFGWRKSQHAKNLGSLKADRSTPSHG